MKRGFLIVLEIALLIMLLRSDFAHYLLKDAQDTVSDWMLWVAQYAQRQELRDLRDQVNPILAELNESQRAYLEEVLADKQKLRKFEYMYCERKDKNPYIYGAKLRHLCHQLASLPTDDEG